MLFQQKNGEIILVGHRKGFTLIESLVSFGIIALLLLTMQLVLPMFKYRSELSSDMTLNIIVHQLAAQKYLLADRFPDQIILENSEGKKMILKVDNQKLKLLGEGAGQIILMNNINKMKIVRHQGYTDITVVNNKGQVATDILFLKESKAAK
ncbi:prepilin-type N-terminal cleavage/methylation domain-containing protein [Leuconostoc citreum]|uniref:prepilin-type N-terminal cleavage/methylation domain-containing protein n=1 Tax=Leuconostoc citreum TaxID=33964 RepID=UPI00223B5ED9|nr:prepilin-type N-terminal cleavage/methylation domain-containing protein [Leuconostoc citreum]